MSSISSCWASASWQLAVESLALLFERFGLAVESFFLLLETALLLGNFVAALFYFAVALGAGAIDLFLRLEQRLALFVFSGFNAFVSMMPLRFILGARDARARKPFSCT